MIRNGVVGTMAIFLFPVVSQQIPDSSPGVFVIFSLLLKEVFLGMMMGFLLIIPFWALEAAGFFMDNQRGASMASTMNPMSGSDSSPMGILFSQTFTAIYLISGLFILMLKSIFLSYQVWPIFSFYPQLNPNTVMFILGQFDLIITWAVWLAAPIVICMFITEFGIALISRSAPQLNVFILAMPIKSAVAVAVAILTIYIGTIMALGKKGVLNFPGLLKQLNVLVS